MLFLFHRPEFIVVFTMLVGAHWALRGRARNALLLAASYGFYASWDWRFLALLCGSTLVDYACGLGIARSDSPARRRAILGVSLITNLGLLFVFKYLNFFVESMAALAARAGVTLDAPTLELILPLGISFYTFQTLSYTIDIYRRRLEPTSNLIDFALFVSFFPQLIAGPIEKARDLLPQLQADRRWADVPVRQGLFLFAQGWALKVIVADPAGQVVDEVFSLSTPTGSTVWIALYAFTLQIYGDFAGYSRMARGTAQLLGVRLSTNFDLPFFARGYVDFYRRWHITLSSWIGEYVYQPLYYALPRTRLLRGVSKTAVRMWLSAAIALFATRMLFAMWHGAAMTFVALGLFIYFAQMISIALRPAGRRLQNGLGGRASPLLRIAQSLVTVHLFALAMLFFRAENWGQLSGFAAAQLAGFGAIDTGVLDQLPYLGCAVGLLVLHEFAQYLSRDPFWLNRQNFYLNAVYYLALFFLFRAGSGIGDARFIYFQF